MWYKSVITFRSVKKKTVTEPILHDAVSYGDVEAQLVECLKGRVAEWDHIKNERVKYSDVIFNNSKLPFYEVKVRWTPDDPEKEGTTSVFLIPAESPGDAENKINDYLSDSMDSYTIDDTKKTKIVGVWHPHSMIWKGDFLNRMDERKEAGKYTWGLDKQEPAQSEAKPAPKTGQLELLDQD